MDQDFSEDLIDSLRLVRTPNVGSVTYHKLIAQYGNASAAISALPDLMRGKKISVPAHEDAMEELRVTQAAGGVILTLNDPAYPDRLRHTELPPPIISAIGDIGLLSRPAIAVVGARNTSAAGLKLAQTISQDLGEAGLVIVSGLARGIDGAAHKATLKTGTIAVVAGGVDQAYPPQHIGLYKDIVAQGLVISERPWGYGATARDFPRRNRIVAALCDGLLVVEAAERSGSLISARLAGELGREVMAVPGTPLDARSAGTNHLIREGAILVRDAEDVLSALEGLSTRQPMLYARETQTPFEYGDFEEMDEAEALGDGFTPQTIMAALSVHPMPLTRLAESLGVSAAQLAGLVTELELSGQVKTYAGGEVGLKLD